MSALVIYAHPWTGSYNHAILEAVESGFKKSGTSYEVIDLNAEGFNPVMTGPELAVYNKGMSKDPKIAEYQKKFEAATSLVVIHPTWWCGIPAILKGFFDKILLKGWAYDPGPMGTLKGRLGYIKNAVVITTMNAPGWYYRFFMGNVVRHELVNGCIKTCGIKNVKWIKLSAVISVKRETREKWLKKISDVASKLS